MPLYISLECRRCGGDCGSGSVKYKVENTRALFFFSTPSSCFVVILVILFIYFLALFFSYLTLSLCSVSFRCFIHFILSYRSHHVCVCDDALLFFSRSSIFPTGSTFFIIRGASTALFFFGITAREFSRCWASQKKNQQPVQEKKKAKRASKQLQKSISIV